MRFNIVVPPFPGSESYFRNGNPCCPLGYILDGMSRDLANTPKYKAFKIPGKYKQATEEANEILTNVWVPAAANIIEEVCIAPRVSAATLEDDMMDLSTSADSTKSVSKRVAAMVAFLLKYEHVFSVTYRTAEAVTRRHDRRAKAAALYPRSKRKYE